MEKLVAKELGAVRAVQALLSIGPNVEKRDTLLTIKMADPQSLWKALLEIQFQLCKFTELPFLFRDEAFGNATHVLEIGYGDGQLVGGLAPYFPEKRFTECPLPTKYVLGAKQKTKECLDEIANEVRRSGRSTFDYLILRVVVQRVSQLGLFIGTLRDYLSEKGALLIIDAYDPLFTWQPSIPTLDALMGQLGEEQEKVGAGRTAAEKIHRRASLFKCQPIRSEKLAVVGNSEMGRRDFYTYFLLLSEVMIRAYGPVLNQLALIDDLDRWVSDPKAKAQFGLHFVELMTRN